MLAYKEYYKFYEIIIATTMSLAYFKGTSNGMDIEGKTDYILR